MYKVQPDRPEEISHKTIKKMMEVENVEKGKNKETIPPPELPQRRKEEIFHAIVTIKVKTDESRQIV